MDSGVFIIDDVAPESLAYLEQASPVDLNQPIASLRSVADEVAERFKTDLMFNGSREDIDIPCGGTASDEAVYSIAATVLRPDDTGKSWSDVIVYFHGGGWVWGSRKSHMHFCEAISQKCKSIVVNVEYRLAPENRYPDCYFDARDVVTWCLANKKKLAGDADARLGVAGDSAGGSISASVCHMLKGKGINYQILIYPSLTFEYDRHPGIYRSNDTYGQGFGLTSKLMNWFENQFLRTEEDKYDLIGSPMLQADFSYLPPALIFVAEFDPLADQSYEYVKKLRDAGIYREMVLFKETVHGYVNKGGLFKKTLEYTLSHMNRFIHRNQK